MRYAAMAAVGAAVFLAAWPARAADKVEAENPFTAPILDVRPRVFLRADGFDGLTIARLRERAAQPEFESARGKWRSSPKGRALLWLLDRKGEDLQAAVAGLKSMRAEGGTWSDRGLALIEMAALFDWLYDKLDEPTRAQAIARIEQAADAAADHIRRGQAPFYYSRTPGALAGMTVAGIALHGVSPKSAHYLDLFRQYGPGEYFKAMQWVDGAATGATYTMFYTYVDLSQLCAAWWSATGKNPNAWIRQNQGDWLEGIVRFYLWSMRPGFAFLDINDQYRDNWASHDQFCTGLDVASYVTRSGAGRAWAQRWLGRHGGALYHGEYAHNFIFRDPSIPEADLAALPTAALFGRESCGYGFFRSHWPAPGKPDDAVHVFFRMGDPMDVHGGVAAGEFQVFRGAPLATRSGKYSSYDSPPDQYHRNAVSTNVVLFLDAAKPDDRGDQATRRGLKSDHRTWEEWLKIRQRSGLDVATITDWQAGENVSRCRADLSRANPATCKLWTRELVWLARRHLVVLDVVETARPEVQRLWQLHLPERPTAGEGVLTVTAKASDKPWAQPAMRPARPEGKLFCRTLLPREYRLIVHGQGKADALTPSGRPAGGSVAGNKHHLQFGRHVVQVDPGVGSARTVFLHVLTACEADRETAPPASCRLARPGMLAVSVEGQSVELPVPEWVTP